MVKISKDHPVSIVSHLKIMEPIDEIWSGIRLTRTINIGEIPSRIIQIESKFNGDLVVIIGYQLVFKYITIPNSNYTTRAPL